MFEMLDLDRESDLAAARGRRVLAVETDGERAPWELDLTGPVLTLLGENPLAVAVGGVYTDPGATAADNVDGDLTASIVVGGDTVTTDVPDVQGLSLGPCVPNPFNPVTRISYSLPGDGPVSLVVYSVLMIYNGRFFKFKDIKI